MADKPSLQGQVAKKIAEAKKKNPKIFLTEKEQVSMMGTLVRPWQLRWIVRAAVVQLCSLAAISSMRALCTPCEVSSLQVILCGAVSPEELDVTLDDVGGLDEVKAELVCTQF